MRMRWAALAAMWTCGTAGAGTYTIDFSALAADAGQVVTTAFDTADFRVYVNAVQVVGPGDAGYSGVVGVVATADQFDVVIDALSPYLTAAFTLDSISATFAQYTGTAYDWNGVADVNERGPMWNWSGTAPAPAVFTPSLPTTIDRVWLTQIVGTSAQMTGLTIDAEFQPSGGSLPEPSGWLLLALGAAGTILSRRLSGRGRRTIAGGGIA